MGDHPELAVLERQDNGDRTLGIFLLVFHNEQ